MTFAWLPVGPPRPLRVKWVSTDGLQPAGSVASVILLLPPAFNPPVTAFPCDDEETVTTFIHLLYRTKLPDGEDSVTQPGSRDTECYEAFLTYPTMNLPLTVVSPIGACIRV